MPEVMEFYRMAGDVDYMLRVVVPDIAGYDTLLQEADRHGAAEERHVALRHGEDQVDDGAADRVSAAERLAIKCRLRCAVAVGRRRDARAHVHLVRQRQRAGDDVADVGL